MFVHRRRNWLQMPVDRVNGINDNPGLFSHVPGFTYTLRNQAAEIDKQMEDVVLRPSVILAKTPNKTITNSLVR